MKTILDLNGRTILITGAAGFIGAALTERILRICVGTRVIGLDDLNDYYDPRLKAYRLQRLERAQAEGGCAFRFLRDSITDRALLDRVFREERPDIVVHLAAQAGVRYSIDHPDVYIESNIIGFFNILEACRRSYDSPAEGYAGVAHLVFASSSSVYGVSKAVPFREDDSADTPVSLYAATKRSGELLAHSYSRLYGIPTTGLRFFTVYGPAGRPDMFYYSAAQKLAAGETISIFNHGACARDFTCINDVTEGLFRVMQGAPQRPETENGQPPYAVYNIGCGKPVKLPEFVEILQQELVRAGVLPADYDFAGHRRLVGMQPGDMPLTFADCSALERDYGFRPSVDLRQGLRAFAEWYRAYASEPPEPSAP